MNDTSPPSPLPPCLAPSSSFPLAFISGQTSYGVKHPFGQLTWLYPLARSRPLPAYWWEGGMLGRQQWCCAVLPSSSKTVGFYQHLSNCWYKAQHCKTCISGRLNTMAELLQRYSALCLWKSVPNWSLFCEIFEEGHIFLYF